MVDIGSIKKEYDQLLNQLSDPELVSDWERFEELNKRRGALEKILEKAKEIDEIKLKIEENVAILGSQEGQELSSLAQTEILQLTEKKKSIEQELEKILNNPDKPEPFKAVIVEIRAGTGGEEAALFAADLFRMYSKYAGSNNWQVKVLDSRTSDIKGFKEVIFEIKGPDVYSKMKNEAGVHRVQRIPVTEKSGRIHTSTVSVAVLPKPKKTEIKIKPDDLRIDYYRASGPGGQNVNKRETAVRITYIPTGLVVTSQTERNQLLNKENALSILEARILEQRDTEDLEKMGDKRRSQIGKAERSEKIRTYNFPQDRVTDHRIKKSFSNIEAIMAGKLDSIVEKLEENQNEEATQSF